MLRSSLKYGCFFLLAFCFFNSSFAFAEEVEKEIQGVSADPSLDQARNEILETSIRKVTEDLVVQIIGLDKYQKNTKFIEDKVFKNSGKFVTSYKTSDLTTDAGGTKMKVKVKVSLSDLKNVLADYHLYQKKVAGLDISLRIQVLNTTGFLNTESLKNELLSKFPELSHLREEELPPLPPNF